MLIYAVVVLVGKTSVGNEVLCFNANPMFSLHL